jgi:electron transport complex protein RnfD
MPLIVASSPHLQPANSVSKVMLHVVIALVPGILAYVMMFGWGVLVNILLAIVTALAVEAAVLQIRRKPVLTGLYDGSAIVTALLLALAVPPLSPWWLIVVGVGFAMIFGKHIYGGLGYNPFNPAMLGYAVLLVSFPVAMTQWLLPVSLMDSDPGFTATLQYVFTGSLPAPLSLDSITSATILDTVKTRLAQSYTLEEIQRAPIFGHLGGRGWEWINLAFLAGGLWLLAWRVISWHIPVGLLGGLFLISFLFHGIDAGIYATPMFHLASGAAILGAFFIATDPVSASTTAKGRLIYAAGIGVITYVIRTWGGYPDGIAFAVLLMNMAVPTIDYYTRPRVFGAGRD